MAFACNTKKKYSELKLGARDKIYNKIKMVQAVQPYKFFSLSKLNLDVMDEGLFSTIVTIEVRVGESFLVGRET